MVLRVCAAICGAAILFVYSSSAMAKLETVGKSNAASRHDACAMGVTIVGTASMYNPFQPGYDEGGIQTASGELYDPIAWTAAIQTDLRETFGGVRHGKDYRPAYALVEVANRRAIIKINDVGPLKPGRVMDFNKQTMRYFDPTLQRGLVYGVKITLLPGDGWETGPIDG
jgi:rare lipoprotein A